MMIYPELKIGDLTVKKPFVQGGMASALVCQAWRVQWRKPEASV